MRLGILGGTFDPVHYGHLLLAETCREELNLDRVLWMPAGDPPHKSGKLISDAHARADMLKLSLSGYPEHVIDRREIRRQGPSWTVDTLAEIKSESPDSELFFLMGADSLRDFGGWREPDRISQLATVVAVNRPGIPSPEPSQVREWVGSELAGRIRILSMPGTDISATELRKRCQSGKELRFLTPRAVEMFISQHGLYKSD